MIVYLVYLYGCLDTICSSYENAVKLKQKLIVEDKIAEEDEEIVYIQPAELDKEIK